jgi:hypothetical protein
MKFEIADLLKGGCPVKAEDIDDYFVCNENGEHVYVLWRQNVDDSEELIDKWVRWRYEIKASQSNLNMSYSFLVVKISQNETNISPNSSLFEGFCE